MDRIGIQREHLISCSYSGTKDEIVRCKSHSNAPLALLSCFTRIIVGSFIITRNVIRGIK